MSAFASSRFKEFLATIDKEINQLGYEGEKKEAIFLVCGSNCLKLLRTLGIEIVSLKDEKGDEKLKVSELLENIYAAYPKKVGKKKGMETLRRRILTLKDAQDVRAALGRYLKYLDDTQSFVKNFSTWVNEIEDWMDEDAGQVVSPSDKHYLEVVNKHKHLGVVVDG